MISTVYTIDNGRRGELRADFDNQESAKAQMIAWAVIYDAAQIYEGDIETFTAVKIYADAPYILINDVWGNVKDKKILIKDVVGF
ncbi:MAG TPA: hypothetical protein PLP33_29485 [Leptospiraceae bacterium]|nr:hypothetical protein [Leptospiraceae bacterium]